MYILVNQQDRESFKAVDVAAKAARAQVDNFADGCFQDAKGADLPITDVTFIGHGSLNRFGGNSEECINGFTPEEFIKAITEGPRKLPSTVKTIHLCACQIGLLHSTNPSYIAQVAEKLAACEGYKHITVRGIQHDDLDHHYTELAQVRHVDSIQTHLIFDYLLITKNDVELRLQHKQNVDLISIDIKELEKKLRKLTRKIERNDPNKDELKKEKETLLTKIEMKEKELADKTKEMLNVTLKSHPLLSTADIRGELSQSKYIVTKFTAQIQRAKIHRQKLLIKKDETTTALAKTKENITSLQIKIDLAKSTVSMQGAASLEKEPGSDVEKQGKKARIEPIASEILSQASKKAEYSEQLGQLTLQENTLRSKLDTLNIKIAKVENEIATLENKDKKIRDDSEMPLFRRKSSVPTQHPPLLPPSMLPSETPVKTPSTEPALHASSSSLKPPESGSVAASWNAQTGPKKDWEQRFTDLVSKSEIPKEKSEALQRERVTKAVDLLLNPVNLRFLCEAESTKQDITLSIKESRTKTRSDLQQQSQSWDFTCRDVSGNKDESCFLHAASDQLARLGLSLNAEKLKEIVIQHLLDNANHYQTFMNDPDKYITDRVRSLAWTDEIMMHALSRSLNVSIIIVKSDGAEPTVFKQKEPKAVLYLGYEVGSHYQSLHPIKDVESNERLQALLNKTQADGMTTIKQTTLTLPRASEKPVGEELSRTLSP